MRLCFSYVVWQLACHASVILRVGSRSPRGTAYIYLNTHNINDFNDGMPAAIGAFEQLVFQVVFNSGRKVMKPFDNWTVIVMGGGSAKLWASKIRSGTRYLERVKSFEMKPLVLQAGGTLQFAQPRRQRWVAGNSTKPRNCTFLLLFRKKTEVANESLDNASVRIF